MAEDTPARVPDIVVVGTPRSGTSSLFYWLDAHPQVSGSTPKETFFFMDEAHPLCGLHGSSFARNGLAAWTPRFHPQATARQRLLEATTHYFYQATARACFTGLESQPHIVIVLREPAARIHSSFRFTRDNLANLDRRLTFNRYVECLLDNRTDALDAFYRDAASLFVAKRQLELSRYTLWLDWWLDRLPQNRLNVVLFEELVANPLAVVTQLCDKLRIDGGFYERFEFAKRNEAYRINHPSIHAATRRLGQLLPGGRIRQLLTQEYRSWQSRNAPGESDFRDGLQALRNHFVPWNAQLARDHRLDLGPWLLEATSPQQISTGVPGDDAA